MHAFTHICTHLHAFNPLQDSWVAEKYMSEEVVEDFKGGLEYAEASCRPLHTAFESLHKALVHCIKEWAMLSTHRPGAQVQQAPQPPLAYNALCIPLQHAL